MPGGGISPDGQRWVSCRPDFFLPVRVLSRLFRRLFLESLQKAFDAGKLQFFGALEPLRGPPCLCSAMWPERKLPSGWSMPSAPSPGLSRSSTTWAAIPTAWRSPITACSISKTIRSAFEWKDYRDGGQVKTMTLSADEFIRRFLLHVLPDGFQRIRYYGFLGNRYRQEKLDQCRRLLGMPMPDRADPTPVEKDYRDRYEELTGDFVAAVSAVPTRPHDAGRHPAAISRNLRQVHRFVMIRRSRLNS